MQSRITCLNYERLTTYGIDYVLSYFLPHETKGGRKNCRVQHTLSLPIRGALCSRKQAELTKKDECQNGGKGEEETTRKS